MKNRDSFSKFLIASLGFHIFIFVVLVVKILIFPGEAPEYRQAVRVDVVALPDKITEPVKAPVSKKPEPLNKPKPQAPKKKPKPPKPKPKPKKAEPKKISLEKKKKEEKKKPEKKEDVQDEQDDALTRLKALQKLKEQNDAKAEPTVEYKNNELSKGNSLTGLEKLHHESYLDDLDTHIRSFWNLPEWLANDTLKARVLLLINQDGSIKSKSFLETSGNELFDQHVLGTLDKASPLPAPPSEMVDFYSSRGVEIRFPE